MSHKPCRESDIDLLTKEAQTILIDLKQDIDQLRVFFVKDFDVDFLEDLVKFDQHVFDDGSGMNAWGLVPLIRHGKVFILWDDQIGIVGSAAFMKDWEKEEEAYLYSYAISPAMQGKGLGARFLTTIRSYLSQLGLKSVSLTVDPENRAALTLYKDKMGFEIAALHENEYGEGFTRYIMKLEL